MTRAFIILATFVFGTAVTLALPVSNELVSRDISYDAVELESRYAEPRGFDDIELEERGVTAVMGDVKSRVGAAAPKVKSLASGRGGEERGAKAEGSQERAEGRREKTEGRKLGGEQRKLGGEQRKLGGEQRKLGGEQRKLGGQQRKLGGEERKLKGGART